MTTEREDEVVEVTRYSQMGGAMVAGHDTFTGAPVGSWIKYEDYIATIAALKAKCEKAEQESADSEQLRYEENRNACRWMDRALAAEAKCVELEKDALRFACVLKHTWVNDQHSLHVYFDLNYDEEMQTRAIALIDAALKERK